MGKVTDLGSGDAYGKDDKHDLLGIGVDANTDPNDPSTWSDELKRRHRRAALSLPSDKLVKLSSNIKTHLETQEKERASRPKSDVFETDPLKIASMFSFTKNEKGDTSATYQDPNPESGAKIVVTHKPRYEERGEGTTYGYGYTQAAMSFEHHPDLKTYSRDLRHHGRGMSEAHSQHFIDAHVRHASEVIAMYHRALMGEQNSMSANLYGDTSSIATPLSGTMGDTKFDPKQVNYIWQDTPGDESTSSQTTTTTTTDSPSNPVTNYIDSLVPVLNEQNKAVKHLTDRANSFGPKTSTRAVLNAALRRVTSDHSGSVEEERSRITDILQDEISKQKKGSITRAHLELAADKYAADTEEPSSPTVEEQNQEEIESGSNVSAQMTEAGIAPAMPTQPRATYQSGGSLSWKDSLDKFNEWRAAKKVTYKDNGPAIRKIAKEIRAKSPGVVGHLLDLDDKFSSLTNNQRLAEDDPRKELANNLRAAAMSIHSHISDKASSSPDEPATELPQSLRADHLLNETPTIAERANVGQPDKIDPNLWVTLSPDQKKHVGNYVRLHDKVQSFQLPNGQIAGSEESLSAYNEMHNYRRKLENSFGATGASKVGNEKYDVASRKVFDLLKEYPLGIARVF
jgi:hypothetical protein